MTGKPHLLVRLLIVALGAIAFHVGPGEVDAAAQTPTDVADLRAQLERRFDVLPLQDGVMLRPRSRIGDLRSIEVHEGSIAVDGQAVTGRRAARPPWRRCGSRGPRLLSQPAQLRTLTGAAEAEPAPVAEPARLGGPHRRGSRRQRA